MLTCLKSICIRVDKACIIGGPTKSELWNQMQADVYGIPVQKPVFEDASVMGAAIAGAFSAGIYGSIAEAARRFGQNSKTYEPNPASSPFTRSCTILYENIRRTG